MVFNSVGMKSRVSFVETGKEKRPLCLLRKVFIIEQFCKVYFFLIFIMASLLFFFFTLSDYLLVVVPLETGSWALFSLSLTLPFLSLGSAIFLEES